jgi:hypothetical protein
MTKSVLEISPSTTVYDLLSHYPELEDRLIAMAAPFKKLRNPALKNSIARIATLKHISSVGNIPLNELIDNIRNEVGQPVGKEAFEDEVYFETKPDWFSEDRISISLVEGEVGDKNEMTIVAVLREAANLEKGGIIELITTFLPAPGIDTMKAKGYSAWTTKSEGETIRTYFIKDLNA